jgi:hypothetical protein
MYLWTLPLAAVITSGQGTNALTVSFGTESGLVTVAAFNDCYRSAVSSLAVSAMSTVPESVTIASNINPVCGSVPVTLTATPVNADVMRCQMTSNRGNTMVRLPLQCGPSPV